MPHLLLCLHMRRLSAEESDGDEKQYDEESYYTFCYKFYNKTAPLFFQNDALNRDLRRVLLPSTKGIGCRVPGAKHVSYP